MPRDTRKLKKNGEGSGGESRGNFEDEVNALFKLPLAEFTDARNTLAALLKKEGRANDAILVKSLGKPSISAWAVNQLYWQHRKAFDSLLTVGQRLQRAQTSSVAGKVTAMRASLDARREALAQLSELASSLLREAGHNPTMETLHRITTTLEAISVPESLSDGPTLGRLTQDVDPPGFESLASLLSGAVGMKANQKLQLVTPLQKPSTAATEMRQKTAAAGDVEKKRQLEETRRTKIAAAKVSLQDAKKSLSVARARAQQLEAAQKKIQFEAKDAERQKREAEERFKRASAQAEEAAERARSITFEAKVAAKALDDTKRAIDKATKELESLLRESSTK